MTWPDKSMNERIERALVGLKMPRALEIIGDTVRRLEHGQSTPLEDIEALLAEELTMHETRRIRTALVMARLSIVKTLAGFDFAFQPSPVETLNGSTTSASTAAGQVAKARGILELQLGRLRADIDRFLAAARAA